MSRVIGLAGPAGCGKSTIAKALALYGFQRVRFAGPLKAMLNAFYASCGLSPAAATERIEGLLKEQPDPFLCGASPRRAMVTLGTEWGRELIAPDLWVTAWRAAALAAMRDGAPGVVADDCRFPNEVAAVHALGGVVVALRRQDVVPRGGHVSEAGVEADVTVENDATPEAVAARIMALCPRR